MSWKYRAGLFLIAAVVVIWVTSAEVTQVSLFNFICSQIMGEISVMTMRLYTLGLCLMWIISSCSGFSLERFGIVMYLLKIVHGTFKNGGEQIRYHVISVLKIRNTGF